MAQHQKPHVGEQELRSPHFDLPLRFEQLSNWRKRGILIFAGAASVLAFAPFHFWPILWVTLPILFFGASSAGRAPERGRRWLRWQNCAAGRAAEAAWWFGFGFHVVGLIWIAEAFLVEAEVFAWLIPVAVTGLPAGLALFFAAVGVAVHATRSWSTASRVIVFAVTLAVVEWLRGHILTGLPWNIFGYALTAPVAFMQSAGVFGIYGLTLIAGLVFVWPAAELFVAREPYPSTRARNAIVAFAIAVCALAALYSYGRLRVSEYDTVQASGSSAVMVRVVQPSVVQREKWRPENQRQIFDLHKSLSMRSAQASSESRSFAPELVVWPEAAMPFFPLDQPVALKEIGELLDDRQILISGALRRERAERPALRDRVFNSLLMFRRGEPARVLDTYDKIHLVPFGEYLPFQGALEWLGLEQLTRMRGGFASARWPRRALAIPDVGLAVPLICYEAIFPDAIFAGPVRPKLLVNVTNDGWFGDSIGPRQHFHQARVRAVETGLPMVRAANNGISAVFDAVGRTTGQLALNERGSITVRLPEAFSETPYSKYGDKIFFTLAVLLTAIAAMLRRIAASNIR